MRQLAHDLDTRAGHASNQAEQGGSWFFRNDRGFRRAVTNFARRAANFHDRMDTYRTAPWQVDDELRGLLNDARAVQARLQRSRNVDEHTAADWSETVQLLNEMIRVYQSDVANGPADRREFERPGEPQRSDRYEAGGSGRGRYNVQQMGSLVHELAERSTRLMDTVNQLSGRYSGRASQGESVRAIQHFTEQADAFHERYEAGLSPEDVRGNVAHLWDDAREADQRFRQANVQELETEWSGMMQLLSRIRSASGS
ncbi:MAG: hypothetical protein M3167_00780 [Acidobacteriota bacterium]|nr:hypothetical protein [Acidobacteriota bacterium]